MALLRELTTDGKGHYGIGASAVEKRDDLYTYLRITDIKDDGTLNMDDLKSVDDLEAPNYLLLPNDIVFARTGASTGRNYFYDGSDGEFVYAGFLIKFSIDPQKVNPLYIKYYCQSLQYRNWIKSFSTGSTRGNINAKTFGDMQIPLPSRKQQDFLVETLAPIDAKIKVNMAINKNLQQQMQNIYYNFADSLNGEVCTLSEIIDIRDGTHDSPKAQETGYPLVTSKHLLSFGVDTSSTNLISKLDYDKVNERSKVDTGDILISMIGTVGLISYVIDSPVEFAIKNVGLFKTSSNPLYALYILGYLKSKNTTNYIEKSLAGSTQKYISLGELRKMPITIPDNVRLEQYNSLVYPIVSQISLLVKENVCLSNLRDMLLPKLMSGEINMSNIQF